MQRDLFSGILLIAGALAGVLALVLHPTGHDLLAEARAARMASLNALVHGVAIAGVPAVFLGLLGLARRLGPSHLVTAALVVWGVGGVAVLSAAVVSGFVAPEVIGRIRAAPESAGGTYQALLSYSGLLNRGFARVFVVASAVAILLWAAAILRGGQMPRAAGAGGAVVGVGVLAGFFSGHLGLDVHGFGLIVFAQSAWLIWLGVLLARPITTHDSRLMTHDS